MSSVASRAPDRQYGGGGSLQKRAVPFIGLLIIPPIVWSAAMALHYSIADQPIAVGGACGILGAATALTAILMLRIGDGNSKRKVLLRWHACFTVAFAGVGVTLVAAVGWNRWVNTFFQLIGEIVALTWLAYRIDAYRRDANKEDGDGEDKLREELGLKGTKFTKVTQVVDKAGEVVRTEAQVHHAPGKPLDDIQKAVPGLEVIAGAPRGRSRITGTENAGVSNLVIIHKDVLKDLIPYQGPSAPGGCISEPLITAVCEDQQVSRRYIAGGPVAINPSNSGWMGQTRTGKSMNAQVGAMEVMTRWNANIFWFDTVKGAQTLRPLRRGMDVLVADDNPQVFKAGIKALMRLVKARADLLGAHGYAAWTPRAAEAPRLRLPFLIVHLEEADVLCDIAPDELVFLASKALSTGISVEISLQRADATSMPTGLRFNVGNWHCFGTGDSYSAGFALSDQVVDAGAHPEYWGQRKVGYHYYVGIGEDDDRGPVVRKSMYATDEQMEDHADQWGPEMMPLPNSDIDALGDWYQQAKEATREAIARWDAGPGADPNAVYDGTSSQPDRVVTSANTGLTRPASAPVSPGMPPVSDHDYDPDEGDWVESEQAIQDEIDEVGDELAARGAYEGLDPEALKIDPGQPVPPVRDEDKHSWRPSKADAPDRAAAIEALQKVLVQIVTDPDGAVDEDAEDDERFTTDGDDLLIEVGLLTKLYPFRSRPWFSEALKLMARGEIPTPGVVLEAADEPGVYRLRRAPQLAESGHTA